MQALYDVALEYGSAKALLFYLKPLIAQFHGYDTRPVVRGSARSRSSVAMRETSISDGSYQELRLPLGNISEIMLTVGGEEDVREGSLFSQMGSEAYDLWKGKLKETLDAKREQIKQDRVEQWAWKKDMGMGPVR